MSWSLESSDTWKRLPKAFHGSDNFQASRLPLHHFLFHHPLLLNCMVETAPISTQGLSNLSITNGLVDNGNPRPYRLPRALWHARCTLDVDGGMLPDATVEGNAQIASHKGIEGFGSRPQRGFRIELTGKGPGTCRFKKRLCFLADGLLHRLDRSNGNLRVQLFGMCQQSGGQGFRQALDANRQFLARRLLPSIANCFRGFNLQILCRSTFSMVQIFGSKLAFRKRKKKKKKERRRMRRKTTTMKKKRNPSKEVV